MMGTMLHHWSVQSRLVSRSAFTGSIGIDLLLSGSSAHYFHVHCHRLNIDVYVSVTLKLIILTANTQRYA